MSGIRSANRSSNRDAFRSAHTAVRSAAGADEVRVLLTGHLGFVYAVTVISIGREAEFPTGDLLIGAVGLLFVILSGVMASSGHWFAGIRTPWTLTSKLSWTKTHRLGGLVFIATGLAAMLGALVSSEWAFYAMFAVMIRGSYSWSPTPTSCGVMIPSG